VASVIGSIKNLALKERLIFGGLGFAFIFLVFAGVFLLANKTRQQRVEPVPPLPSAKRVIIPPEELFLPEEPDFIPGVLLERERRASWSVEDAESFWQDPLKNGEEQWRDQVEAIIGELMERVP
jgi:hypothetical protein